MTPASRLLERGRGDFGLSRFAGAVRKGLGPGGSPRPGMGSFGLEFRIIQSIFNIWAVEMASMSGGIAEELGLLGASESDGMTGWATLGWTGSQLAYVRS